MTNTTTRNDITGEAAEKVRIVLIDDHVILREGLRALLEIERDLAIVGEADTVEDGLSVAKAVRPDLIVTDIALAGGSALGMLPLLKEALPGVCLIVLTAHCTDEYVRAALKSGAMGYILKDASRRELLEGIRAVLDGRQYLSSAVTHQVISGYLNKLDGSRHAEVPITMREKEVLKLIALAYSTKHIASRLKLSVKTIEKHRSNLMRKLALQNTAAVTLYAVRHKLIPVDVVGQSFEESQDLSV
jgi:two-component system, NarL family, response regulator NreC